MRPPLGSILNFGLVALLLVIALVSNPSAPVIIGVMFGYALFVCLIVEILQR